MGKPPASLIALEVLLSLGVLGGIRWLFANALYTYWCLGSCKPPEAANIWAFRLLALATVGAVVGTFAIAWHRRARWSWAWHIVVGVAAAVAIVFFAVPELGLRDPNNQPVYPNHPQCMSPGPECDKLGG